jgi:alanine racemase
MDQCVVNLGGTGDGVVPGDDVFLFGESSAPPGDAGHGDAGYGDAGYGDAALMAETLGTIPYEITCGIGKRVPRIYAG